jgi:hypothetical protein
LTPITSARLARTEPNPQPGSNLTTSRAAPLQPDACATVPEADTPIALAQRLRLERMALLRGFHRG